MNKKIFISIPLVVALSGCAMLDENAGKIGGVAVGASAGAVIGSQIAGDQGLIIGGLIGGGVGLSVGYFIDERRALQKEISKTYNVKIEHDDIKDVGKENGDKLIAYANNKFKTGKSSLTPNGNKYFQHIAKTYANSGKKILIVGHSDDSGNSKINQTLSEQRAKTVGKIFAKNGTNIKNIYYWGAGESWPIADNNKKEGREKNRRVEIIELNDESEIIKYTQNIKANPSYFTQQIYKQSVKISKKPAVVDKKIAQKTKETKISKTMPKNSNVLVDFGGDKTQFKYFSLAKEYGRHDSGFSLIPRLFANITMTNCAYDKYHEDSEVKALLNGKVITKTTDYKKGLNKSVWNTTLNNNMIALAPVGVLSANSKPNVNPNIFIYENYILGSKSKANYNLNTKVNTYQGTDGLLYRVFVNSKNSAITCMDIVFDNDKIEKSIGYLYYSDSRGNLLEKKFKINPIKK